MASPEQINTNNFHYQHVLLDWDGCLADTLSIWLEAYQTVATGRGHRFSDREIGHAFGSFTGLMESVMDPDPNEAMSSAVSLAIPGLRNTKLHSGALGLLRTIRNNGQRAALVSSSNRNQIEHSLQKFAIESYTDVVITGEMVSKRKPDPEPFIKAMQLMKANPRKTLVIGDSDSDILAAQAIGVDSLLYYPEGNRTYYDGDFLRQYSPTFMVSSFTQARKVLSAPALDNTDK